jgi:hypothetical protein
MTITNGGLTVVELSPPKERTRFKHLRKRSKVKKVSRNPIIRSFLTTK